VQNKEQACLQQEQIFIRSNFLQNCIVQGVRQAVYICAADEKNSLLFWKKLVHHGVHKSHSVGLIESPWTLVLRSFTNYTTSVNFNIIILFNLRQPFRPLGERNFIANFTNANKLHLSRAVNFSSYITDVRD